MYMYISYPDHSSETGVFRWVPLTGVQLLSYRPTLWHLEEYRSFKRQLSSIKKKLISSTALTIDQLSYSGGCPSVSQNSTSYNNTFFFSPSFYKYMELNEGSHSYLSSYLANLLFSDVHNLRKFKETQLKRNPPLRVLRPL